MNNGRFKYEKLAKYPHLSAHDIAVWENCIKKLPELFDTVDYDVCVGKGADFLSSDESTPDGRENRLYQKKIDVVGFKSGNIYLAEVKPTANMRGLGQCLAYHKLYTDMHDDLPFIKKMIICAGVENELLDLFKLNDIIVIDMTMKPQHVARSWGNPYAGSNGNPDRATF